MIPEPLAALRMAHTRARVSGKPHAVLSFGEGYVVAGLPLRPWDQDRVLEIVHPTKG